METILVDTRSNNTFVSEGEDNISFPWKFDEDWLNSFWVMLQYVRKFERVLQIVAIETTLIDIHGNVVLVSVA